MNLNLNKLEKKINIKFKNIKLLTKSLTHKSYNSINNNEKLSNGKIHKSVYKKFGSYQDSDKFTVPEKHYFFLGDNRECCSDSRYLPRVVYVHEDNFVGKDQFIFFSSDYRIGTIFKFWKWHKILRINRFFKKIS